MSDRGRRPTGTGASTPPAPAAMDDEGAQVGRFAAQPPVRSSPLSAETTDPGLDHARLSDDPTDPGLDGARLTGNGPARGPAVPGHAEPAPPPVDVTRAVADDLRRRHIEPLVGHLRSTYAVEHTVFPNRGALESALGEARARVGKVRHTLREAIDGYGGPNTERVMDAWDDALVALGEVELQEDRWDAEPQSLLGAWRRRAGTSDDGEAQWVRVVALSALALREASIEAELEGQLLPALVDGILAAHSSGEADPQLRASHARVTALLARARPRRAAHYRHAIQRVLTLPAGGAEDDRGSVPAALAGLWV